MSDVRTPPIESVEAQNGTDHNSIGSRIIPIVFIPGVMGSRISIPSKRREWDPDSKSSMIQWLLAATVEAAFGPRQNREALTPAASRASVFTKLDSGAEGDIRGRPRLVAIANEANSDAATFYGQTRGWAGVAWGFYGAILMFLEEELVSPFPLAGNVQSPVYAFGYDWRKSNADNGAELVVFIDKVLQAEHAEQVILVTHSMGGLVARGALIPRGKMHPDGTLAPKVRGAIHTVQPSLGAVVAYRRFFTGWVSDLDGGGLFDPGPLVLGKIMGTTPGRYAFNLSGCPGATQLLPNRAYNTHFGNDHMTTAGDHPNWLGLPSSQDIGEGVYGLYKGENPPGLAGIVRRGARDIGADPQQCVDDFIRNVDKADSFHLTVAGVAYPITHVIFGTGLPTDHRFEMLSQFSATASFVRDGDGANIRVTKLPNGDGTVPRVSGRCPKLQQAAPAHEANELDHSKVFADDTFRRKVRARIQTILSSQPSSP